MRFFYSLGVGLLGASLLFPKLASAQTTPCPPAGIRTDPAIAVNPGGQPNRFNWYYGDYLPGSYNGTMYTLNSPLPGVGQPYIELPWLQPNNPVMDRFSGKIDKPSDGWELIRRDLGYDDAGNPTKTANPTLILYNRYTSILRVFTAVGDLQLGFQLAEIRLKFGATAVNKAGTLNRQSALGVALEDTEPHTNPAFAAVARYLNGRSKWFVADFPMDYDPCICQFDSRLQIDVNLISQADVRLIGKTTGSLVSAGNGASTTGADFEKGIPFIRKVNNLLDAGGKSYDNIDKFTSKLSGQDPSKSAGLAWLNTASKTATFLKQGLGALPYVGAAMSMLDYFMGGGQDAGPQQVVMQPMAIEMTTTTTGTITTTDWATGVPFHNPGNRITQSIPQNVPYYNEAMGVFSLLKKPTIESTATSAYDPITLAITKTRSYRLAEDLQYVINPASGLEVQDFQVALVVEGSNEGTAGGDFYNDESSMISSSGVTSHAFRTDYIDAACIKNNVLQFDEMFKSGNPEFRYHGLTMKVMLNLRPINGTSTQQNVLFVSRYPVTLATVSGFAPLPPAACGVLPQANLTAINAVCGGPKYTSAIVLTRPSKKSALASAAVKGLTLSALRAFPNPANGTVQVSYSVVQAGQVRITLSDALGREVRTVVDQKQDTGTFEIAASLNGLRAGIYYCTMHTATQHTVEKIVVAE